MQVDDQEGSCCSSPAASCTGCGHGDDPALLLPENLDDSPSLWLDMIQELTDLPSPSSGHFRGSSKLAPAADLHALLSSPSASPPLYDIAHLELNTQLDHRYHFPASARSSTSSYQLISGAADLEAPLIGTAVAADADHPHACFPDKSFSIQAGLHDQQSDYGHFFSMKTAQYGSCPQLSAAAQLGAPLNTATPATIGGDYANISSQTSDGLSPPPFMDYAASQATADSRSTLTGFPRFNGSSAKLKPVRTLQKVCSAPQLAYAPYLGFTSSTGCRGSVPQTSSPSTFSDKLYSPPHYHSIYDHNGSFDQMLQSQQLQYMETASHSMHGKLEDYHDFLPIAQPHFMLPPPGMSTAHRGKQAVERGLELVHMLLACAGAVAHEDHEVAKSALLHLHQLSSKTGSSMQRVSAYFAEALHARLTNTGGRSREALLTSSSKPTPAQELLEAYQVLYQACPYIKFAHFTCNQAIFEAFEGEGRVHIVDLDIRQGYQWPAFIQALAARPGGAPHLRITGVGTPLEAVQEAGKRLGELAESLHVSFEFNAVGERVENLKAHMLQRKVGEALAINSITSLHSLPSSNKSLPNLLHMLLEQAPNIFTLVEQEASHNGPFFLSRFLEALHYYSAIFDSLDATLPRHSLERAKVEKLVFAQEILNIVACEGMERVERHEKLDKWRMIMQTMGFQSVPVSANAINQSKILLGLYPCFGYMLKEDKGALQLGWQDRLLIGASAWSC